MDILILEDNDEKHASVAALLAEIRLDTCVVDRAPTYRDFLVMVERRKYDLIVADLMVPRFRGQEPSDVTADLIETLREVDCANHHTPVVALTSFDEVSDSNYKALNTAGIAILKFDGSDSWRSALSERVADALPKPTFDFVVVCALPKEVHGFVDAGYDVEMSYFKGVLDCRNISIGGKKGVIVTAARMGLVTCAITTTQAIEYFNPSILCMSGICAGISGKARLLDVAIADVCHQHDFGKWSISGYEPEIYTVSLKPLLRAQLRKIVEDDRQFRSAVTAGLAYDRTELPDHLPRLEANVFLTPASSGSAVIADEKMVEIIKEQQRKGSIFEMESFALYEAARLHPSDIPVFSAKAVVDDGTSAKGDAYHRVACALAARTVGECLARLAAMAEPLF